MDDPLQALSLAQLRHRTSEKWRAYPPDVLPLWVAEMDVPLARPVVDALVAAVTEGDTGYATGAELVAALAGFARRRWGWRIPTGRARVVPDVMGGVVELLGRVTGPGDAVVVNPPVYPPFFAFVEHAGRRVVEAPLRADHRLDLDALAAAFGRAAGGGRSAAYLLCSPHNPTGTVHSHAELAAVAELAAAHGVRVVADEIHAPVVLPPAGFVPYLSVPGTGTGFSLISASKGWNLAGIKAAVAIAGPQAADELAGLPEIVGHGVSHLGVLAHAAAFREGEAWLDALLAGLAANQRRLADRLAAELPGVAYHPAPATFLAWLDCRSLGLGEDPAAAFLERGRVALNPGPSFGPGGAGHARLNLATSTPVLDEAVRRMAAAV